MSAMKKLLSIYLPLVLFSILFACSTDNDPLANVVEGMWTVHLFTDDGQNKTSNYNGYTFNFNSNGSLTATIQSVATPGTWSKFTDSGREKLELHWMGGGIPVVLLEIEEDWILKSNVNNLMVLTDTSGSTGKAKELHLQRR